MWDMISIFKESSLQGDRLTYNLANKKYINRWKDYLPVGQRMPGTRFIAFKVPLKKVSKSYFNILSEI